MIDLDEKLEMPDSRWVGRGGACVRVYTCTCVKIAIWLFTFADSACTYLLSAISSVYSYQ